MTCQAQPLIFQPDARLVAYLLRNGFVDVSDTAHEARKMYRWQKSLPTGWLDMVCSPLPADTRLFFHSGLHRHLLLTTETISFGGHLGIAFEGFEIPEAALWYWLDHKNSSKEEKATFKTLLTV